MATETLVFVHGSGDSGAVWAPLITLLPDVHAVALDLPGHGALVDQPGPAEMSV
ncbi:MAG: alpha/beta fold hydrolase, partial [Ktedonobacterales bacterium]